MNKELQISIITVCFNSAEHIADALRSVDAQTWSHIEHLVIDGASRDGTVGIVEAHAKPWRKLVSEPDKGIYDAMNKGLRMARGDIIGFINSDDFYASPDVLAKVAQVFADPDVDACYGDLCYVKRDATESIVRYWRSAPFQPGMFLRGWCPPHPTLYIRRSVYEQFGRFDLQYKIAADVELMSRFLEVHRIRSRYVPDIFVKMRMGGTTNQSWSNVLQQNQEIWRAFRQQGLQPSLPAFVAGKLLSRGKQFLTRPD